MKNPLSITKVITEYKKCNKKKNYKRCIRKTIKINKSKNTNDQEVSDTSPSVWLCEVVYKNIIKS